MELSTLDQHGFVVAGECPHCLKQATFPTVTPPAELSEGKHEGRKIGAARCIACGEFILVLLKLSYIGDSRSQWFYDTHYPLGKPDDTVSADVPTPIRTDFQEAIRAEWIKAYKACV